MAELQGLHTNHAHNSAELQEIVCHEAGGRSDTNDSSQFSDELLQACCVMGSWYLSFQSRTTLSGQVGETGHSVGRVMDELTGSPGSNSSGKIACRM